MSETAEPNANPPTEAPELEKTEAPASQVDIANAEATSDPALNPTETEPLEVAPPTESAEDTTKAEATSDSALNPTETLSLEVEVAQDTTKPEATEDSVLNPTEAELPEVAPSPEAVADVPEATTVNNPTDDTTSALNPVDESTMPTTEANSAIEAPLVPLDGEKVGGTMKTESSVEPAEPVSAEPPPYDREPLAVVYLDGGTRSTRLLLVKGRPGSNVSLTDLGAFSALQLLRDPDRSPEAEAEFLSALRASLSSAAEACGSVAQVVLGLTAWYRESAEEERSKFTDLWDEIGKCATESVPGCTFEVLGVTGAEEGRFEYRAATYVAKRALGIDLDCVLSLGGGSIQCTCGPRRGGEACSFVLNLEDGEEAIAADGNGTGAWEQTCTTICVEGLAPCIAGWTSPSSEQEEPVDESEPYLLMSGASWYAALGAGLAGQDGPSHTTHSLDDVLQKLKDAAANPDGELKVRANVVRLYTSLESLLRAANEHLRSRCKIVFAREWKVDDEPFRVTWSVGHFMEILNSSKEADQETRIATTDATDRQEVGDLSPKCVTENTQLPEAKRSIEAMAPNELRKVQSKEQDAPEPRLSEVLKEQSEMTEVGEEDTENPFTLPAKANHTNPSEELIPSTSSAGPPQALPQSSPQRSQTLNKKQMPKTVAKGPGLVVYIVAPAAAATGEAALSAEEYAGISTAALRSGAAVVISASASGAVAALDFEVNRRNTLLREVDAFADSRFKAPGNYADDESPLYDLFKALAIDDTGVLDAESIALGLRSLGFQGDVVGAAAALTPEGSNRVARADFVNALKRAAEQPELVAVCPGSPADTENLDSDRPETWPVVREIKVETGLASREFLEVKAREACNLQSETGHGIILVLAGRGRSLLQPSEYEYQIRQELLVATELLPPRWPLLWSPGPAELGLLSEAAMQRPVWALPKPCSPETLISWLRYLLVVRPSAPISGTSAGH